MNTLYFDLSCGAAGDMILSALIDLGVPIKTIKKSLETMQLPKFSLTARKMEVNGITARACRIRLPEEKTHRNFKQIRTLISKGCFPKRVKERAVRVFERIAKAEGAVHGVPVDQVHFHEVGALDSVIDVVGSCIAFDLLGVEKFYTSALTVGTGTVTCRHGVLPVPAPATTKLIKGFDIRVLDTGTEILTPTGAGIITALSRQNLPDNFHVKKTGYGTGTRRFEGFSNLLRIWLGELGNGKKSN